MTAQPPILQDAIELAKEAHAEQTDKAGAPYFGHLERVMNGVKSEHLKMIAVLHDTLEDTFVTRNFLEEKGYPNHIIDAIEALTKLPDEEGSDAGYEKFIRRAAQNSMAMQVKMADLRDNMDLSRLPEAERDTEKVLLRLERYKKSLTYLEETDARRNLVYLRQRLNEMGDDFNPASVKIDEYHQATLTGFIRYAYTLQHKETGELQPQEILSAAMKTARDEGLDDHPAARIYDEYLQSLPPDPDDWNQEILINYHATLARCRHLFLLAMQQDLATTPAAKSSPEEIEQSNLQTLAIAAQTLAQGVVIDGTGQIIKLPESEKYQIEDFKELRYPRYFLAEQDGSYSTICLRGDTDRGINWDVEGHPHRNWSMQGTFWWPLITTDELDRMISEGKLPPPSTEGIDF